MGGLSIIGDDKQYTESIQAIASVTQNSRQNPAYRAEKF